MSEREILYAAYLDALSQLQESPQNSQATVKSINSTYDKSLRLANTSVQDAKNRTDSGTEAIERHLANARGFLAKLDQESHIPPRIKPSAIPTGVTGTDVDQVLHELSRSTIELGIKVDEHLQAGGRAPATGLLPKPIQHASSPTQKRGSGRVLALAGIATLTVVVATIIFIFI